MIPRIDALNAYLDRSIEEIRAAIEKLPREESRDWKELNDLFLSALE